MSVERTAVSSICQLCGVSLRIHDKIGRGRFGDVYRAWDPSLEREVALKLLRHDHGATDRLVVDEGRLMARVRHPNVATIYGALRINGRTGLWMELIAGQTLEAELAARGPFPAADLARIGIELCHALTAVHRAGLVHRDVKASNVLQEAGGRIVLGDFGTGHELHETADATAMAGTPAYLAPEVFQNAPATPQRDVYSLGALLFRLATGSYPIRGRTIRSPRRRCSPRVADWPGGSQDFLFAALRSVDGEIFVSLVRGSGRRGEAVKSDRSKPDTCDSRRPSHPRLGCCWQSNGRLSCS